MTGRCGTANETKRLSWITGSFFDANAVISRAWLMYARRIVEV